jgi:hypothetical protein
VGPQGCGSPWLVCVQGCLSTQLFSPRPMGGQRPLPSDLSLSSFPCPVHRGPHCPIPHTVYGVGPHEFLCATGKTDTLKLCLQSVSMVCGCSQQSLQTISDPHFQANNSLRFCSFEICSFFFLHVGTHRTCPSLAGQVARALQGSCRIPG